MNELMVQSDSYIYVVSGYMEHSLFSVERLNIKTGIWEYMSNVNIARTKFGIVPFKNRLIFALGGKLQDASRTDLVEEYDVKQDRWVTSNWTLPKARSGFSTCIVNDTQIFIVGGNDGSVLDWVDVYDLVR